MGYMCLGFDANSPRHAYLKTKKFVARRLGKDFQKGDLTEYCWWPCFANVEPNFDEGKKPKAYTIAFNISWDYDTDYIDSPDFVKRVRNWIRVGKTLGLQFQELKFQIVKSTELDHYRVYVSDSFYKRPVEPAPSRVLMFYLPLENINTRKMLHLHLFFLRYLYEKHATVDRFYELRSWFKKDYPWISTYGTLQLAEQSCKLAAAPKGTEGYRVVVHHFLSNKSLKCVILTAKGIGHSNIFLMAKDVTNFDTQLAGPNTKISDFRRMGYVFPIDGDISTWRNTLDMKATLDKLSIMYKQEKEMHDDE